MIRTNFTFVWNPWCHLIYVESDTGHFMWHLSLDPYEHIHNTSPASCNHDPFQHRNKWKNQDPAVQQYNSPQATKQLPKEFTTPGSSSLQPRNLNPSPILTCYAGTLPGITVSGMKATYPGSRAKLLNHLCPVRRLVCWQPESPHSHPALMNTT